MPTSWQLFIIQKIFIHFIYSVIHICKRQHFTINMVTVWSAHADSEGQREINHESHILQCCPPSRQRSSDLRQHILQPLSSPMSLSELGWAKPMFGMNNWLVSQRSFLWSVSWTVSVFIVSRNAVKWRKCLYFTCGLFFSATHKI